MKGRVSGRDAPMRAPTDRAVTLPREHNTMLVRLRRYCELTGETTRAVHDRRRKGRWVDGKHCFLAPDHRLWVNLSEVNDWIRNPASRI